jgi:hypothetical protein
MKGLSEYRQLSTQNGERERERKAVFLGWMEPVAPKFIQSRRRMKKIAGRWRSEE